MEIKFTPNLKTNLEFYFDIDYTTDEMTYEINKYIKEHFWFGQKIELEGDWTRVPVVKHKLKLVHCPGIWDM